MVRELACHVIADDQGENVPITPENVSEKVLDLSPGGTEDLIAPALQFFTGFR